MGREGNTYEGLKKVLDQPGLPKHEIREVFIHNEEPYYTTEDTQRVFKILVSAYTKDDLDRVSVAAVQLDKKNAKIY